jgi:HEAT repeat protein
VEDIRAAAVRTLGELRDATTLDAIVACLEDASPLVKRHAIEALGRFADRRVAPVLRSLLAATQLEIVREALRALGACRDSAAEPEIARRLEHPDSGVRCAAAEALGLLD